jgi:hypothetical protein
MPRYVLLEHDHPVLHWDLMLEAGDGLRTWRLAAPPQPGPVIPAVLLGNHRKMYLDYEGPVSGNRGHVVRWDAGAFTWQAEESGRVVVELEGQRLHGTAFLEQVQGEKWSLTFVIKALDA